MFNRSRRRIVAAIMSVLVLLWAGTLGVIYLSSYMEMKKQNAQMLQAHADMYTLPQGLEGMTQPGRPAPGGEPGFKPGFDPQAPSFRLSTFYSVAVSYEGQLLHTKNDPPTVYSNEALEQMAERIINTDRKTGVLDNLTYLKAEKNGYILVAFMDNTVVNESAMTLFRYTLIFGGVALLLFFFLSVFLARRIVAPLEESYRKQKQFISDAGHELKTPICVVSTNAELLSRELGQNQWLANIQYENQRMGLLVEQLLELSRTENVVAPVTRVDLSRLVAGEALPFESVAFEKGLALNTDITDGITVEGNCEQLRQLVAILLDNAIAHSKPAGTVRLALTREHGIARLSVINPAEQIPPEQLERIFERFYRMDAARNGEQGHYGLGLAIARAVAQSHRGTIQALCYDGLVELRVTLPASKEK